MGVGMKLKDLHRGANGTGGTPLVRTFSKGGPGQFDPAPRRAYHRSAGSGSEVRFPAVSCLGIIVHFVQGAAFGLDISVQRKGGSLCTARSARNGMRAPRATCTIIRIYMITRAARPSVRSASL